MTKAEKKKRLSLIVERLKEIYPSAECALACVAGEDEIFALK